MFDQTVTVPRIPALVCPDHGGELEMTEAAAVCRHGHAYPIEGGFPRFVQSGYAEAFGRQWQRFRRTQLDSHTGITLSTERLRRCFGWSEENDGNHAEGKTILEAGCGAGRFTEVLLDITSAHVTSVDLSDAVVANAENFPPSERHRIAQADIRQLPFEPQSFDYVMCLGVVQHTPDPEQTVRALWNQVKPGGTLVIDHYTWDKSSLTKVGQVWRQVYKRLPADKKLPAVERTVDALLPVHRRLSRYGKIVSRVSPVLSYYHLRPDLPDELHRDWAILDTHDALTDYYKHRRSPKQIRNLLEAIGGEQIWVERGGNGVEARMCRPA
jgi:2-polyprenyl-3-methyl-5-hydroxy-6-metoxy-1,4-benzoquinol methylase